MMHMVGAIPKPTLSYPRASGESGQNRSARRARLSLIAAGKRAALDFAGTFSGSCDSTPRSYVRIPLAAAVSPE